MSDSIPLLLQPAELEAILGNNKLLIVDLSNQDRYLEGHVPGAIHLPPSLLQCGIKPAAGKLPDINDLITLFSELGLAPDKHIIAYDDEGGGWAGRLIWTLDVIGHPHYSYLDGGIHAWANEGHPCQTTVNTGRPTDFHLHQIDRTPIAETDDILAHLTDDNFAVWDARSKEEYEGIKVLAKRGGHIPGAIHCEWTDLMDKKRNLRLLDRATLIAKLNQLGLTPDKHIVTHCQSHHRSSLTYLVAKILNYPDVKGYHGSWGEWGNRMDTPIES